MLGLGLALSIAKKTLGDAIDGLLSTLRGRATYYENGSASKSTIKAIDNADILDKATILLTPTAYSDARVHSVKTYTGDELVTNGTFDTDSNWTKGTGWSIANGKASSDGTQVGISSLYQSVLSQDVNYKIQLTISDYVSGSVGVFGLTKQNQNGTFTYYYTPSSADSNLYINADADFVGSIDNVSVVDISSDFDFDRASSATRINSDGLVQDMQSITDPELVLNGDFEELGDELVTNGDFANWTGDNPDNYLVLNEDVNNYVTESNGQLRMVSDNSATIAIRPQPTTMLTVGKTYKVSVDLTFTTGTLNISGNDFNTSGTKVFYLTAASTYIQFAKGSALDVLIDNVSVQQVDPNNRWTLGTGWNIADGHLNFDTDDGENNAQQQGLLTVGRIYKMTFDANVTTGTIRFESGTGSNLLITSSDTTVEHIFEADLTALVFRRNVTPTRGYIDNISVKDITFSTDVDLARINYDSNGANGHILLEPTSTNLLTYSEDFSQSTWNKTRCTITANQAISPDGTLNADLMTATDNDARLEDVVASSGIIVTQSIYVKSATGGNVSGQIDFAGADAVTFTANNEWQRVETTLSNTSISPRLRVRITNNADSLFVWGGQVEQLSYATSYIPTLTGSTVTRATETLTGSGNSTLINSTEGVLYAEIAALADDISGFRVLGISDGGSTNRIFIGYTSNNIYANVGAGTTIGSPYTPTNASDFHKVALKYENNNCKFFVDGSQIGSTTTSITIPSGMNSLQFDSGAGGSDFYGKCKALAVFNEALSDTELQNLTS